MFLRVFTEFHVAVSLVAIASGCVVVYGLFRNRIDTRLTTFFLAITALTVVTGFLFPFHGVTPAQVLGVVGLIVLGIALWARRLFLQTGRLRKTYVSALVVSLYLNVFVLVVQLFEKVPSLRALAPTQKEAPFKIAQLVTLLVFVTIGIAATTRFRGETMQVFPRRAA
jgi:hypothetical protein